MGLFEPGTGSADGTFIKQEERAVLTFNKVVFPINSVKFQVSNNPQYDDQYLIETVLPGSDEQRVLGFSAKSVPNRAAGLAAICEQCNAGTWTPINVRLVKDGKATLIEEVE